MGRWSLGQRRPATVRIATCRSARSLLRPANGEAMRILATILRADLIGLRRRHIAGVRSAAAPGYGLACRRIFKRAIFSLKRLLAVDCIQLICGVAEQTVAKRRQQACFRLLRRRTTAQLAETCALARRAAG